MSDLVTMLQGSLFCTGEPELPRGFAGLTRHRLDDDSWIEVVPGWLAGADLFFAQLAYGLPWAQHTVPMYDRLVLEPRLVWWWQAGSGTRLPSPLLEQMLADIGRHYGVALASIGCNFYRDGNDSVAWHGDRRRRVGGGYDIQPFVATVSVGAARPFLVRPRGGGAAHAFLLGQGDLCVMGGACQETWEHSIPKQASAGPRISIVFRTRSDRAIFSSLRNPNSTRRRHTPHGVRVLEHSGEAKGARS